MNKNTSGLLVDWKEDKEVKIRVLRLVKDLSIDWVDTSRIYCFRSKYSKARAYARIWGLSRIWQLALNIKPAYVVEVISEKYDKLSEKDKDKVILHELTHIPKNFSGSLMPHIRKRGKRNFYDKVNKLVKKNNQLFANKFR